MLRGLTSIADAQNLYFLPVPGRALVGKTAEERDAEDLQGLPARHAHDRSDYDQRRSSVVHSSEGDEIGRRRIGAAFGLRQKRS